MDVLNSQPEYGPHEELEPRMLDALGYPPETLDVEVESPTGIKALGRNFLDVYGENPHRSDTERDMRLYLRLNDIEAFQDDEDFIGLEDTLYAYTTMFFGEPPKRNERKRNGA